MSADTFEVEVVHATPQRQHLLRLRVEAPCTAEQAVHQSGILALFPGLDITPGQLGIFGEIVDPGAQLTAGDRVELYRALENDPKAARRRRAGRR